MASAAERSVMSSKMKIKYVEPRDKATKNYVTKMKESQALHQIQQIYLKKQPNQIKFHLEQNKILKNKHLREDVEDDPLDPKSFENVLQAQREQEALDLSPGEISELANKQGNANAINRAKKTQALKFMQDECQRIVDIIEKNDPIRKSEQRMGKTSGLGVEEEQDPQLKEVNEKERIQALYN